VDTNHTSNRDKLEPDEVDTAQIDDLANIEEWWGPGWVRCRPRIPPKGSYHGVSVVCGQCREEATAANGNEWHSRDLKSKQRTVFVCLNCFLAKPTVGYIVEVTRGYPGCSKMQMIHVNTVQREVLVGRGSQCDLQVRPRMVSHAARYRHGIARSTVGRGMMSCGTVYLSTWYRARYDSVRRRGRLFGL
jgi:hypothetical protein